MGKCDACLQRRLHSGRGQGAPPEWVDGSGVVLLASRGGGERRRSRRVGMNRMVTDGPAKVGFGRLRGRNGEGKRRRFVDVPA
jgi:hypothetical protein